ncbi:MAG: 1-deoxy-D-xylulose-5-phosphate reductoisomerase [Anaerovoracaceae bacterium]|jgi:1-deoxy-D-xylulose-5-phosphate reductoisomerase
MQDKNDKMLKNIVILGSTGSIGTQALDVIRSHPDRFHAACLSCGRNTELLRQQIAEFHPEIAVCQREEDRKDLEKEFPEVRFYSGAEGVIRAATGDCDLVLNALVGIRGLVPTYQAIQTGHDVALANKETLVTGGRIIMETARENGVKILPVDSEHSAIFQCLEGNPDRSARRLILTASGGPFRGYVIDALEKVTPEEAVDHPNWKMGKKVSVDSATMMNKGLEVIEAKHLFGMDIKDIDVVIHPQSVIHSAVEFEDGAILAQLSRPDMRIPISFALGYPERIENPDPGLDLIHDAGKLEFEEPNFATFRCLGLAIEAEERGGAYPVVMNAANEVLVNAFLNGTIGFLDIQRGIEKILEWSQIPKGEPSLVEILRIDRETREKTEKDILP